MLRKGKHGWNIDCNGKSIMTIYLVMTESLPGNGRTTTTYNRLFFILIYWLFLNVERAVFTGRERVQQYLALREGSTGSMTFDCYREGTNKLVCSEYSFSNSTKEFFNVQRTWLSLLEELFPVADKLGLIYALLGFHRRYILHVWHEFAQQLGMKSEFCSRIRSRVMYSQ